jgi:hypothetical protein
MTRRISAVAACCSRASLRALVISEYDGAGGPLDLAVSGVPHAPQNAMGEAFSCWHRGHFIGRASLHGPVSAWRPEWTERTRTLADGQGSPGVGEHVLDASSSARVSDRLIRADPAGRRRARNCRAAVS